MGYTIIDSGEDRAAWLLARTAGVTATDIARLAHGGPATWDAIKAEKLGLVSEFYGNRYTRWGNEREPVIAAHAEFLYGVTPNHALLAAEDEPRFLATPDAIGPDLTGEFKTTVEAWEPIVEAIPARYVTQCRWAQRVTGRQGTAFAYEPHEGFIPQPVRSFVIPRDLEREAELESIAHDFFDYLATEQDLGEFDGLLAQAAEAKAIADEAQAAADAVRDAILAKIGDRPKVSAKSPAGSLSYYTAAASQRFDAKAFEADNPDTYRQYLRAVGGSKPQLRLTLKGA